MLKQILIQKCLLDCITLAITFTLDCTDSGDLRPTWPLANVCHFMGKKITCAIVLNRLRHIFIYN